ncbi:MAG: recombination mediator RecR [Rhodobacteraceae bacterium]|nr:recombination mediator RecR [Paracoccaceae bacterium]
MAGGREVERLIDLMAKLPGLGPVSARRAVLTLIRKKALLMAPLATAMAEVEATVRECRICANITTDTFCEICRSPKREQTLLCVVESVADLWAMERGAAFKGRYFVLGGVLSALDGITPEGLRIPELVRQVLEGDISEVILALNATMDGQTTAHYIADQLSESRAALTSLAQGVPIGGELNYLDDGTIAAALNARKTF